MFERLSYYIENNPRQTVRWLIMLALIVLVGWAAIFYLGTGSIRVKTNDPSNNIELRPIKSNQGIKRSTGELHARVRAGQYNVVVSNRVGTTKKVVSVQARKSMNYTINLSVPSVPEAVLPVGATSVSADDANMYYVSMDDHFLYKIGIDNVPAIVNSSVRFGVIRWQTAGNGYGLSQDNKRLYSIVGGAVQAVELPFNASTVVFDLSKRGVLVVSDGSGIYVKQPSQAFAPIYSSNKEVEALGVGGSNILLEYSGESEGETTAQVIDITGKPLTAEKSFHAYGFGWSPDGRLLAVNGNETTELYNNKLESIKRLPDTNVLALQWQDNGHLLYGVRQGLYQYSVTGDSSVELARLVAGGISGIYPSDDGRQLFILTGSVNADTGNPTHALAKVELDEKPSDLTYRLGVYLPFDLDGCYVGYANFTDFTVIVYPVSVSSADTCLQAAKARLSSFGVNVSKLRFSTVSLPPQAVD
jgi:hypothetical protein